ncbi:MAG TPA: HlyD family secretion protein [Alphaproteobacteria bacterium]|nr:HlyD family secretion protein [Alphaproteobacteria bacterium]
MKNFLLGFSRILVTAIVVIVALVALRFLWERYQVDPWTRDGRIRADTVQVAPDVSGLITDVLIHDNQIVHKGDPLFIIDRPRFELALRQADALIAAQQAAVDEAALEDKRNHGLGNLVSTEILQQGGAKLAQAQAALLQAMVARDIAKLNLERTTVYAPVNGVLANVELRPGDYATAGRPLFALVDSDSLHIEGYFEETKLPRIRIGDPVSVRIMGEPRLLKGHVESIAGGIEDRERGPSGNLLPNISPTFSWVRLAQRVPVRVKLENPPPEVRLIAGRTVTVTVLEDQRKPQPAGAQK